MKKVLMIMMLTTVCLSAHKTKPQTGRSPTDLVEFMQAHVAFAVRLSLRSIATSFYNVHPMSYPHELGLPLKE